MKKDRSDTGTNPAIADIIQRHRIAIIACGSRGEEDGGAQAAAARARSKALGLRDTHQTLTRICASTNTRCAPEGQDGLKRRCR